MSSITLEISESELREVANAYRVLQDFLDRVVSPNELYTEEFLDGLAEAKSQIEKGEMTEVRNFADFLN